MVTHEAQLAAWEKAAGELEKGRQAVVELVAGAPLSWEAMKGVARVGRSIGESTSGIATSVGAQAFAREWKWVRLTIPLQTRLAAEQGLWDLGGEYRRLISGFRPIDVEEGGARKAKKYYRPRERAEFGPAFRIKRPKSSARVDPLG